MLKDVKVSFAPHISKTHSTRSIMLDVIIALVPAIIAAGIFFKLYALEIIAACVITAVITESICNRVLKRKDTISDLSAAVTGLILALSLPPQIPVWVAMIGAAFSIYIGKMVFGGLGANIFNPAMVGRAFLTASFGILMTTWTVPATIESQMPTIASAQVQQQLDARTQATPLAYSKDAIKEKVEVSVPNKMTRYLFTGSVAGCLGETSSLALIIGGIYLLLRKTITFHIPAAVLISAFVIALVTNMVNPEKYMTPINHILGGGLLIGAFFIATDPVTAPLTKRGMWIFGIGIGAIVMLIRLVGEYPEGVMYAVLLMNGFSPLIDRFCKKIPAGGCPK